MYYDDPAWQQEQWEERQEELAAYDFDDYEIEIQKESWNDSVDE